jgi:predicted nucleotidyltransferase
MSRSRASVTVPRTVQGTIEAFVAGVRARFGGRVARIRLFGSYARGEASEVSDVDCLVLLDRVDREDDRAVTDLAADLTRQRDGVVISPMVMSDAEFETWKARERATPLAIALLLTEGIEPRSHAGTSSLLGLREGPDRKDGSRAVC